MRYLTATLLVIGFEGSCLLSPFALPTTASLSHTALSRAAEAHALGQDTQAITEANWQQHPKIVAIRKVVSAVDAGLKSGAFKISRREFDDCWNGDTSRRIARDAKGLVRYYETYGYGEEHDTTNKRYYDVSGRLRFVYIIDRWSGIGTGRIYFDESGKRVWENYKFVKGATGAYGVFGPFGDEYFQKNPSNDFKSPSDCPEIKRKAKHQSR
jgi:hypothetical protein